MGRDWCGEIVTLTIDEEACLVYMLTSILVIGVDINVGIAINAKGGDCWIMLSLMPMVCLWFQWFDYLGDCWIICKWFSLIDVIDWCKVIDWYDALDENDICSSGNQSMQRWIIIVLSWLIRCTNGWTPKWSPYGEIPHGKTLYGLIYPRRMVGGPMLLCGIMR